MDYIADLLAQFDRDDLRVGLRRASGARLSIMIGNAESALRRLILMAALAFTPAPLKPHRASTPAPRASMERPRCFRIFQLCGQGAPPHRHTPPSRDRHGHIL
ncbi:MAG: hypothetical protein EON93_14000, partial [Burkholderiales bacterium]